MKKNQETIIAIVIFAVFIISIIPVLYCGWYAHPLYDDYDYSWYVHNTIQNGGGIKEVLQAAANQVSKMYFAWQGTFTAIFIFALQPGAFSEEYYFLTTFIMIGSLLASLFFIVETVVVRWLKGKISHTFIISSLLMICYIQFIPDKLQGLYWFNGSSYYTLFYSMSLLLIGVLIRLVINTPISRICFVLSIILAFIIGGGNYTTALICIELITLWTAILIFKKNKKWKLLLIILLTLVAAFSISALAPGNMIRAEHLNGEEHAVTAIIKSMIYGLYYIGEWTKLPQVIYILFITPIMYGLSQKCKWEYKCPLIVLISAFLFFSSQITPPMYAMSSSGAGRQINIYYYGYYLMITFCDFYLCGWLGKNKFINWTTTKDLIKRYFYPIILVMILIFGAGCMEYGIPKLTSIETTIAIVNGTVKKYDEEFRERIDVIKTGDGKIRELETIPVFFGELGITTDNDYWINRSMRRYYGAEELILIEELEE